MQARCIRVKGSAPGRDRPGVGGDRIAGCVAADEGLAAHRCTGLDEGPRDLRQRPVTGNRCQQGGTVGDAVGNRHGLDHARQRLGRALPPAGDADAPHLDVRHDGIRMRPGDREHRQPGRMVAAFYERQPGDDFRDIGAFQRAPPGAVRGTSGYRHQAEIALGRGHRRDHAGGTEVGDHGDREAEMKPLAIAHRRLARGEIGMDAERRLHIGEGGDDDAPDAFDGVERQHSGVPLDQAPHHVGLARRAERRAGFGGLLGPDQAADDLAALHQQPVHGLVDPVDLGAQFGEGGGALGRAHFL